VIRNFQLELEKLKKPLDMSTLGKKVNMKKLGILQEVLTALILE
jgi:hypothetical protein